MESAKYIARKYIATYRKHWGSVASRNFLYRDGIIPNMGLRGAIWPASRA